MNKMVPMQPNQGVQDAGGMSCIGYGSRRMWQLQQRSNEPVKQARNSVRLLLSRVKLFKRGTSMSKFINPTSSHLQVFIGVAVLAVSLIWPSMSTAQNKSDQTKEPNPHAQHLEKKPAGGQDAGVPKQEMKMPGMDSQKQDSAWWFNNYNRGQMSDIGGKGMAHGEDGMTGMKGMTKDKVDAGSMAVDASSSGRGMMDDVDLMGMMVDDDVGMMGEVAIGGAGSKGLKGMGEMKMAALLPGSPGVSRLYHIGATGFFLNHPEHITLTTKQQSAINSLKQKTLLSKFTAQRKIEEAEQELWELTGADEPDAAQIQAKVQDIEKLRGEQRMAFIQLVGEAAKVLTDEQRQMLLGTTEPAAAAAGK